ncbi:flagellar motor protein [Bacterioplanoides pacificum]|uniref:Flagellar motor protein n=1 Tax=Bacterioplanoides pacificum TaxID=1171596 RepID=A0ABV7VXK4_9GAMM
MDRWSLVVVLLALAAVVSGHLLEGGSLSLLWNPAAALIVFGGSLLAACAQIPLSYFRPLLQLLGWLIVPPVLSFDGLVNKLVTCGHALRRDGVLALEKLANIENDVVFRKALMLLADGYDDDTTRETMELELNTLEQRDLDLVGVLDNLAGYLPTLGIVGAVLGLMQVLSNIQQPDALAQGIATAFVATFYGVAAANLVVIPLANTLRQHIAIRRRYYDAMLLGLLSVRQGVNPASLRFRLQGVVI